MSKDNKTLADVQPGGRVRLGDQVLSTSEGARRYVADFFATQLRRHDFGDYILTELACDFACALAQHLSAQPSPGGHGGLNYERMFADACAALAEVSRDLGCDPEQGGAEPILAAIAELREALAARQPVGEPVAWMHTHKTTGRVEFGLSPMYDCDFNAVQWDSVALYAAPAQAVDLEQEPMFYIQDTRQFVGNCPVWWGPNGSGYVTRLDEAGRYTEQEAVKQNRCRETDIPWPCAEIEAIARRTVDFQHMRPRAERLAELAQVDSKAAGNG